MKDCETKVRSTPVRHLLLLAGVLLTLLACGDESTPTETTDEPEDMTDMFVVRCVTSQDCRLGAEVCRESFCVEAPGCTDTAECEVGEYCTDSRLCSFNPSQCTTDRECLLDEICEEGICHEGCRTNNQCGINEFCSTDFVCERRLCTDVRCEVGFECQEDTGECVQLPCDGGCEGELLCDIEKDACVECIAHPTCGIGRICNEEGTCENLVCDDETPCPEGTFCINDFCEVPPPCDDDEFEPNNDFFSTNLETLEEGITYNEFVACPYDEDFWLVGADGDHSLTVEVLFDGDAGNLDFALQTPPTGVVFARGTSEGDDERLTINIFKSNLYTLRVYRVDSGLDPLPYQLRFSTGPRMPVPPDICVDDGFEPNNSLEDATPLFDGRWSGPNICEGDEDFYQFHIETGIRLRACVYPSELVEAEFGAELVRSDGTVVTSGSGLAEFCVEEDSEITDDYRVRVFGIEEGIEAPYHIGFEILPGCRVYDDSYDKAGQNNHLPGEGETLEVLPQDEDIELRVCHNDSDFWPVAMQRRDRLEANISFTHDDGNLQMRLHRPSGSVVVASLGNRDEETINYQAEETGIYHLRVYGEGEEMGPYTFTYSVIPWCEADASDHSTVETAIDLIAGESDTYWLCAAETDYFAFDVPDAFTGSVTISLTVDEGEPLMFTATPNGGDAVDSDEGGEVSLQDPASGALVIEVSGAEADHEATYTLTIQTAN